MSLEDALNKLADAIADQAAATREQVKAWRETRSMPAQDGPTEADKPAKAAPKAETKKEAPKAETKKEAVPEKPTDLLKTPEYKRLEAVINKLVEQGKGQDAATVVSSYGIQRVTEAPFEKWSEIAEKLEEYLITEEDDGDDEETSLI